MIKVLAISFLSISFISGCATPSSEVKHDTGMKSYTFEGINVVMKSTWELSQYHRIAVTDFQSPHSAPEAGLEIADRIAIQLMKKGYKVIERDHLKTLLKEKYLNYVGVVSPENLKEFQSISGADAIITGTIGSYQSAIGGSSFQMGNIGGGSTTSQSEVSFTIKMFDIENGEVLLSAAGSKAGQNARGYLADKIISDTFLHFPATSDRAYDSNSEQEKEDLDRLIKSSNNLGR